MTAQAPVVVFLPCIAGFDPLGWTLDLVSLRFVVVHDGALGYGWASSHVD